MWKHSNAISSSKIEAYSTPRVLQLKESSFPLFWWASKSSLNFMILDMI